MTKLQDLTKYKFGRLQPIEIIGRTKRGAIIWRCQCDCGVCKNIVADELRKGSTKSCGCLRKERFLKHNKSKTRLYNIWRGMKSRCNNKNNLRYKHYGEKGIKICDEWNDNFECFYNWAIQNNYKEKLTIDRIDVNGDYKPSNCRWISYFEQNQNRKHHLLIKYKGETYNLAQLSRLFNISYGKIYYAYNNGHIDKILEKYKKDIDYKG